MVSLCLHDCTLEVILASMEHGETLLHVLKLLVETLAGILVLLFPHCSQGIPCRVEEKHSFSLVIWKYHGPRSTRERERKEWKSRPWLPEFLCETFSALFRQVKKRNLMNSERDCGSVYRECVRSHSGGYLEPCLDRATERKLVGAIRWGQWMWRREEAWGIWRTHQVGFLINGWNPKSANVRSWHKQLYVKLLIN